MAYRSFNSPLEKASNLRKPVVHIASSAAAYKYFNELVQERKRLGETLSRFRHVSSLVESEIQRVLSVLSVADANAETAHLSEEAESTTPRVVLERKIFIPVDKYPGYNFVGRILGPRGMTAKQLEEETGCKIMVRGRNNLLTEPLHVLIYAEDDQDKVEEKMKKAVEKIQGLLTPPPEGKDDLKRKQLIELAIINGTYRQTSATMNALQTPRLNSSHSFFGTPTMTVFRPPSIDIMNITEKNSKRNTWVHPRSQCESSLLASLSRFCPQTPPSARCTPEAEKLTAAFLANPQLLQQYLNYTIPLKKGASSSASMGDVGTCPAADLLSNPSQLFPHSPTGKTPSATQQQYSSAAALLSSFPLSDLTGGAAGSANSAASTKSPPAGNAPTALSDGSRISLKPTLRVCSNASQGRPPISPNSPLGYFYHGGSGDFAKSD